MFFNGQFPFLDVDNGGKSTGCTTWTWRGPVAFRNMLARSAEIVGEDETGQTLDQVKNAGLPLEFEPWTRGSEHRPVAGAGLPEPREN